MNSQSNIAVAAGVIVPRTPIVATPEMCDWLVIENESPLSINVALNGIGSLTVPPQFLWPIRTRQRSYNWDGSALVTPAADVTIASPPSTFVRFHVFLPGEECPVQQPIPLVRSTSVGGGSLNTSVSTYSQIVSPDSNHGMQALYNSGVPRLTLAPVATPVLNSFHGALGYVDSGGTQRVGLDIAGDGSWSLGPNANAGSADIRGDASNNLTIPGAIASLGGQATAGALGAAGVVGSSFRQSVIVTTAVNALVFTPTVTGLYKVYLYAILNGTGATISIQLAWTDPDTLSGINTSMFVEYGSVPGGGNATGIASSLVVSGSGAKPWFIFMASKPIAANAGNSVTLTYHNTIATPADHISSAIERVA